MGWKVPPAFADTGSTVYRRCDAVVTGNEYNTRLISWLQLLYEGRLVAKAGLDWSTIIESARIAWLQLMKTKSLKHESTTELQKIIRNKISEDRLSRVELRLSKIEDALKVISSRVGVNLTEIVSDISNAIIESLKSASDVGQYTVAKIKRRKLKSSGYII